jgi:hypothetical protein
LTAVPRRILLFATLATALAVRLPGIGWGLPPVTSQVRASDLRSSYAFDEDDILSGVAQASVAKLDLDPREYHWGTLHCELVLLAMDGAQALGVFGEPWRQAYFGLTEYFARVYVVARLVAVAAALLTVWLLFQFPGEWAGPFCAMLVAVSPAHMLQSDQVRVDATMTAMLALTIVAAVRARRLWMVGLAGGLAVAAKYSIATSVAAIVLTAVLVRKKRTGVLEALGGGALGFVLGATVWLIKPREVYHQIVHFTSAQVPKEYLIPTGKLLALHAANLARFTMGLPALLLAIVGLVVMLRRRQASDWVVLAGLAGYLVVLPPLLWPLVRYNLPLLVFLGLAAGCALERLTPRLRYGLTAVALAMPLAGSVAQIQYMRDPHPANVILERIEASVPPGTAISRLVREAPPLDPKVYPMGENLFMGDLAAHPTEWVLVTDLADQPYKPSNMELLRTRYQEVGRAESRRILPWATLGESGAPQDWKYTHFGFILYRRKSP